MIANTHAQRVLNLAAQKGMLRAIDLEEIGSPQVVLTRMVASGQLQRVGHGLYRLPDYSGTEHENLATIAARVPQAVFCLLTALLFHDLGTQMPSENWIAMPRGSHVPRMDYPPLKMVQMAEPVHAAGVETHVLDDVPIRVFSIAKTVVDCFKFRNKLGLDVALEALRDAREKTKVSVDEIWHYAELCRVAKVMRPYLAGLSHECRYRRR